MHIVRVLVAATVACILIGAAVPAAASELPMLPTVLPGADAPMEDRLVLYDSHQIRTQFMGKPCIYGGATYFYYELRHVIDASPDAARHRRNALALKGIGLGVAIPALVAVVVMAIAQVDPLVLLLVATIDLATVIPLTIGQMVELDRSVKAYNAWLREQLVLDPIGEGLGSTGRMPAAGGLGLRW